MRNSKRMKEDTRKDCRTKNKVKRERIKEERIKRKVIKMKLKQKNGNLEDEERKK